ncbi:hypothetical protein FDECE_16882, partial [Fusarium decemcellulare]
MPSMTSSRSFRASIMPSMLRSNTDPESSSSSTSSNTAATPSTNSHDPRKKTWQKSNTVDLAQLRDHPGSPLDPGSKNSDAVRHDSSDARSRSPEQQKTLRKRNEKDSSKLSLPKSQSTTNLHPAKSSNRKSRFWGDRLSSLLPSLILPSDSSVASPPKPSAAPTPAPPAPAPPAPTHSAPAPAAAETASAAPAPAATTAASPAHTKSSSPTNTSTTTNTVTTTATAPTTVDDSPSSTTPSIIEPTIRMAPEHNDGLGFPSQG